MASVTGRTAQSIDALLDEMVTSVRVESGQLIYQRRNGEEVNGGELVNSDFAVGASWPVNSIFISTVPTDPATLLGVGTWVRHGEGKVLVSQLDGDSDFGTAGQSGGAKTVSLTTAQLAAHTHTINHDHASFNTGVNGNHQHGISLGYTNNLMTGGTADAITRVGGVTHGSVAGTDTGDTGDASPSTHVHSVNVPSYTGSSGASGAGAAHNNLQPYIVVYIWKRTA